MRYSNRELKGLPAAKEVQVSSLSEYIELLSNGQFKDCIFRGEPTNYRETISSALRNDNICYRNTGAEYPFIKMRHDFKREIWHKLTQDERAHFSAFAQHHGIPTNLIDFTTSPLVALYFSCQPYKNFDGGNLDENKGFVYVVENKVIDVTDIIVQNEDENILELFVGNKSNLFLCFYELFSKYEKEYPLDFYKYFQQLNDDWYYYFANGFSRTPIKHKFPAYDKGSYKLQLLEWLPDFLVDKYNSILVEIERNNNEVSIEALIYTLYLQRFLSQVISNTEPIWWFNCIPNFVYFPILSFDRGRNQQGLFVYQTYLSFIESVYEAPILAIQRMWADTIIVIGNKKKILEELDFIGINEKFIYGDYDNIAGYIRNKYR